MAGVPTLVAGIGAGYELTVVDIDPLRAAICASGEFDLAACHDLAEVLQQQTDAGRRTVRLDLSQVTFLDCSCLGVLVSAHQRFVGAHGLLVLTGVDGAVGRLFTLTHLDGTFFVVPVDEDPFGSVLLERAARRQGLSESRLAALPRGKAVS